MSIGFGVRSPNVIYKVTFDYKGNHIDIVNQTGTAFVGNINCELSSTLQPIAFKIGTISHLKNLFLRKNSRFVITSENENIVYFLNNAHSLKQLSQIANKENFSPSIICQTDGSWNINTSYHLEINDWMQVVEPTIQLYKDLIDAFEEHIASINHKQYRETVKTNFK